MSVVFLVQCPALRRRRHHRARHQHRPDGPGHRRGRLGGLPRRSRRCCPSGSRRSRRPPRIARAGVGAGAPRSRSSGCTPSAAPPTSRSAQPGHRDGRLARADRRRRGGHHRPRGRQHRRRPARPRVRRAPGAREARRSWSATRREGADRMRRSGQHRGLVVAGAARRPAARRRRRASTPPATRTASTGSPRTRASPSTEQEHATSDGPARRLRDQGRRRRPALRRRGRRASAASWSLAPRRRACALVVRRARGPRRRAALTWAPGTATSCTSTATRRCTGLPAHLKLVALVAFMLVVVATPRDLVRRPSSATCWCSCVRRRGLARCRRRTSSSGWSSRCRSCVFALLLPFVADGTSGRGARRSR